MKLLLFPFILSLIFEPQEENIIEKDFEQHFKAYNVEGSFLLFDLKKDEFIAYNKNRCRQGFLPASTYKIPNSLFALEAGIITPADTIYWNGEESWNKDWNRNHLLNTAFSSSCVPCYQQLARKIGHERMRQYASSAVYGKMDIKPENIDSFWLTGESRISQFEQIDFLIRLYKNQLPFAAKNMQLVKEIMIMEKNELSLLRAKTGLCMQGDYYIGWFVGYLEKEGNTYFFALNMESPLAEENPDVIPARKAITMSILKELGVY